MRREAMEILRMIWIWIWGYCDSVASCWALILMFSFGNQLQRNQLDQIERLETQQVILFISSQMYKFIITIGCCKCTPSCIFATSTRGLRRSPRPSWWGRCKRRRMSCASSLPSTTSPGRLMISRLDTPLRATWICCCCPWHRNDGKLTALLTKLINNMNMGLR